ncbi:hypothetical protein FS749_005158 [Ceratobasidium sp. UAMH 11750]|nr:hypothetical protein FS749_005158 [Ceratobasidium sp. UAMH 11750]
MSESPSAQPAAPLVASGTAKEKEGGTTRSRVYIACTLCRQRKIKCGGEQPTCRNCSRADFECRYDAEPKRRGPDKKPGTRVRTRKDSTGAVLPPKPRVPRPGQAPASSTELPLVPSQAGPTRNKKRVPRGSAFGRAARTSLVDEHTLPLSSDGAPSSAGLTRKISPPTLPRELEWIVPSNAVGRVPPGRSSQDPLEIETETSRDQVSPSVRLPQLPALATQALLDKPGSSNLDTYRDDLGGIPARYNVSGHPYTGDGYGNQAEAFAPEDPLASGSSDHSVPSSDLLSAGSSQQSHSYSPSALTDATPSPYVASSVDPVLGNADSPSGPPTGQPTSPVFTRLQHTHDPHFRLPADVLAGLAYPRAGIVVPALGRGTRLSTPGGRRGVIPDSTLGGIDVSAGLGVDLGQPALSGIGQASGLVVPSLDEVIGDGSYGLEAYTRHHTTAGEFGYQTLDGNTHDYDGNYAPQATHHYYRSPSSSPYSTQADAAYLPPSESSYATSVDSYASQSEDYRSMAPTPTEITILPPPAGGLAGLWNEDGGVDLYDESVGYVPGVYGSVSDGIAYSSEYDEATLTESESQTQTDETTLAHHHNTQLAQRMFYKSATSWVSEPSVAFARKTWWDNLLEMYAPTKAEAAQKVTSDLKYLFKSSNYWLSFLNINLFMTNYNHRERRENIQPSLLLAALAYSTFTQSSEIEKGSAGRARAMELRNYAQAALEASLNSQRLDPTLAQAAWLLALFEVSAHPEHSTARSRSALVFLDNIIRLLGLTVLDVMDPAVKVFSPDQVPRLPLSPKKSDNLTPSAPYPLTAHSGPTIPTTCACHTLSIVCTTTHAQMTPFWVSSPGWDPSWTEAEIRREESRRLVWSSLTLAAGFTAHDAAFAKDPADLHLVHASNYALCFPAELMMRGVPNPIHSSQESVWALYARAMLLWNSCLSLRKLAHRMTDTERAEFAVNVWLETNTIEEALNRHTCAFERNSLFQGREYLFNTRMFISWEFRRYIPSPDTEVHQQFHRRKAEEWLRHQAEVAKRLMQGLHTVTGLTSNVLGKRPYFVWWFMSQVSRCLSLWQCDQSLFIALEVARAFLPPIDYLTCLWPCPAQRSRYYEIRQRLHNECVKYGLEPPPPPQLVIPTAVLI